jgi:trimeric autotransporter adhesin
VALGREALNYNTSGAYNVALGTEALRFNTTGNYNTALGYSALTSNTTGSFNTGLGYLTQTGDFSGSLILGAEAAATANGQLALGSSTYPLGPVVSEVSASSTHTFAINLNGNTYRLLMIQ